VELIHAHGLGDVLDLPLAHILEGARQFAADLVVDGMGHEHATRLSQCFQPRRNVDAITVDPSLVVDHISQIDPDAKPHAAILGHPRVALSHHGLDLDRTLGGADDAGKLSQDAIAGGIDDPPPVPADQRQDHALMGLEVTHGGGLVFVHEPAVARDIGGKNGGKPALYRELFVHDAFSALAQASRWSCCTSPCGSRGRCPMLRAARDSPQPFRPVAPRPSHRETSET
jgi:hypothetical protein